MERMLSRAASEGRAGRHARGDRAAARRSTTRETEPVVEHYRATGQARADPRRPDDRTRCAREIQEALEQVDGSRVIIRKSRAGDRADGAGRRGRRRDARAARGAASQPGVTTAELDAIAEEFIRSQRRRPDLRRATAAIPARDLHLAERHGRARHPGRRTRCAEGDIISVDVGVTLGRLRRRLGVRRSPVGEIYAGGRSACSTSARPRSRPGSSSRAGSATASATSRRRSRRSPRTAGFSVVRSLVGHGVGRSMHEDPQVPELRHSVRAGPSSGRA